MDFLIKLLIFNIFYVVFIILLGYSCRSHRPDSDTPIFINFRLLKCHLMIYFFIFSNLIYFFVKTMFLEIPLLRTEQAARQPPPNAHRKVSMDENSFVNIFW